MRLMKTVSSVGSVTERSVTVEAVALGDVDDARAARPSAPCTPSTTAPSTTLDVGARRRCSVARTSASASRSPSAVTRDDGVGADRALELGRACRGRAMPAVVDDREPVAELVGLLHVVRGEEDRLAVGVELAEDLPQRDAALRVEAGGRLVEEQDRRAVHDRPGHHEPLRHAARQREHRRVGRGRRGGTARAVGRPRPSRSSAVHPEEAAVEVEVLAHVERAVERVASGARRRSPAWPRPGGATTSMPPTSAAPAGRDHPGGEHPGGGGLARAVRAEQPEDLAARARRGRGWSTARMSPGYTLVRPAVSIAGAAVPAATLGALRSVTVIVSSSSLRLVRWSRLRRSRTGGPGRGRTARRACAASRPRRRR